MILHAVTAGLVGAALLAGGWLWAAQGQAVWLAQALMLCG